jgi:hypothetical protein
MNKKKEKSKDPYRQVSVVVDVVVIIVVVLPRFVTENRCVGLLGALQLRLLPIGALGG